MSDPSGGGGMWASAWQRLRRRPMFFVACLILFVVAAVALFPSVFTDVDPHYCTIADSLAPPRAGTGSGSIVRVVTCTRGRCTARGRR